METTGHPSYCNNSTKKACESTGVPSRSSSTQRAGDMLEHSGRQLHSAPNFVHVDSFERSATYAVMFRQMNVHVDERLDRNLVALQLDRRS
jgi:hypothetical protein